MNTDDINNTDENYVNIEELRPEERDGEAQDTIEENQDPIEVAEDQRSNRENLEHILQENGEEQDPLLDVDDE